MRHFNPISETVLQKLASEKKVSNNIDTTFFRFLETNQVTPKTIIFQTQLKVIL